VVFSELLLADHIIGKQALSELALSQRVTRMRPEVGGLRVAGVAHELLQCDLSALLIGVGCRLARDLV
jgi:hypothetical protein